MKTLKQLREDLIKGADLRSKVIDPIREQYFRGEIFNVGDLVECAGVVYQIEHRGTNHLVLIDEDGNTVRKFPQELSPINEDQYGADYVYSETKNKDGSRRKNHIKRIEFANSGMITKSKRVVDTTKRVQKPLTLKPAPISNPYKKQMKDDDNRRSLKSFVRKLEKAAHPERKKPKNTGVDPRKVTGGAPQDDKEKT